MCLSVSTITPTKWYTDYYPPRQRRQHRERTGKGARAGQGTTGQGKGMGQRMAWHGMDGRNGRVSVCHSPLHQGYRLRSAR